MTAGALARALLVVRARVWGVSPDSMAADVHFRGKLRGEALALLERYEVRPRPPRPGRKRAP